jgi:hypothetical protein
VKNVVFTHTTQSCVLLRVIVAPLFVVFERAGEAREGRAREKKGKKRRATKN